MSDLTRWKVVLVDDEPDSLDLIHDILTLNGAEVHRAVSGDQCLALLESVVPTLIVLDLAMPDKDGWEVLTQLRANPATNRVPVVAITAYHSPKVEQEAHQAGFDAYFAKPIKSDTFLNTLTQVCC